MPKIVDFEKRIEEICDLAYFIFIEVGVKNFSLNSFISSLKMSKGQFYYYFNTKEDLVFEVVKRKSYKLIEHAKDEIAKQTSFRDKLFKFFTRHIDDVGQAHQMCNKIINDVLHMYLNTTNPQIRKFNEEIYAVMFEIIDKIFEDEIIKKGLPQEYKKHARIAMAVSDGMYLQSLILRDYDVKNEFENYLNYIVKIFEG